MEIDAAVVDADGAKLAVNLYVDEKGRLLELEVLRFEGGPVVGPNWATLRLQLTSDACNLLPGPGLIPDS